MDERGGRGRTADVERRRDGRTWTDVDGLGRTGTDGTDGLRVRGDGRERTLMDVEERGRTCTDGDGRGRTGKDVKNAHDPLGMLDRPRGPRKRFLGIRTGKLIIQKKFMRKYLTGMLINWSDAL